MCQIQFLKRTNGNLRKKDQQEFIKLMYLGNLKNYHAFGLFNHEYLIKAPGNFNYQKINERRLLSDNFVIGHNRFATVGESQGIDEVFYFPNLNWITPIFEYHRKTPSKNFNNHPFKINDFVMVHNGTIWNYKKLRKKFKIETKIETDSFVILWLFSYFFGKSIEIDRKKRIIYAIQETTKKIEGDFSVMIYDKATKKEYYFRNSLKDFSFRITKNLIIGSSNEKNLKYVYEKNKKRKYPTFPGDIYEIDKKVKWIGYFQCPERRFEKK